MLSLQRPPATRTASVVATLRGCAIAAFRALVALSLTTASVHAEQTFCVDSVAEFDTAYRAAEDDDVVIRVVRGTYDMTGSCLDDEDYCRIDDDITIRGGYAPGCGSRTLSAVDTVLTRPGGGLMIETSGLQFEGNGDVVLESLTFRDVPDGIRIWTESDSDADAYVSLRRLWLDQTGGLNIYRTAEVALRQSLITRTTASCAVRIEKTGYVVHAGFLERATLSHVTIADSSGDGLCIGGNAYSGWVLTLMNNIFWDNDGDDIKLETSGSDPIEASVRNNTYASLISNNALSDAPQGTLFPNPQFVNPAVGEWELGGTSTSINSAFPQPNVANDFDLKGDPRQFSIAADRGALESPVGSTATTLVVTNTADSGLGSLRQALLDTNQSPNFNRIEFDIGNTCGPHVINLASNLPAVLYPVQIDGYTQPGASCNTQLSGSNAQICVVLRQGTGSSAFVGLQIGSQAGGQAQLQVDGLGFSNFLVAGISLAGGNGHTILGSQFGGTLGALGLAPSGYGVNVTYGAIGVQVGGPEPADRNVFNNAEEAAISLSGGSIGGFSTQARVQNNYIGLAANGSTARANGTGIRVYGDKHRILDNVISSNTGIGIDIIGDEATDNLIESNVFGRPAVLCIGGACERGNGSHGVRIRDGATRNTVRYNTFANNGGDGVAIVAARANPVQGNSFHSNGGEGIDLGDNSITPNDNDAAAPPAGAGNVNQNYPLIATAEGSETSGTVSGSLDSINGWYQIELYASNECGDFLNLTEGRYPLGRHFVQITNAAAGQNGWVSFANLPLLHPDDPVFFDQPRWILATATRYSAAPSAGGRPRETSEFGPCVPYVVTGATAVFADGFENP